MVSSKANKSIKLKHIELFFTKSNHDNDVKK